MTSATSYDDPLWMDRTISFSDIPHRNAEVVPVPTGLSDEEDAGRYLALRYDNEIYVCPNCEAFWRRPNSLKCPHCGICLGPKDMRVDRRKRNP